MRKPVRLCLLALLLAAVTALPSAAELLNTYTYDYWGDEKRSPAGYRVGAVLTGETAGTAAFKAPQDLFIDENGDIYVADTENARVVVLDTAGKFRREYTSFTASDGGTVTLSEPTGLFVSAEGELFIVDREQKHTLRCTADGRVLTVYEKPDTEDIAFTGIDYIPQKVVADRSGYVFILCKDLYQGTMMYTLDGKFVNYFGANRATLTLIQQMQQLTKRFMTKEQRERITQVIPNAVSNMDIDENDFLYTSTAAATTTTEQLRRLNPKGVNIMESSDALRDTYKDIYGDLRTKWANGMLYQTKMVDVAYDSAGLINGLDQTFGRIFQYDLEGHLVFAFGGTGTQEGLFEQAVAVDSFGGSLYVLDSEKNSITVFEETTYGAYIHEAIRLYNEGKYDEAERYWLSVIDQNCNYSLTYIGLGKIKYEQQDYRAAMAYFRQGEDRTSYGEAFKQVRNAFLRAYGLPVLLVVLCAGLVAAAAVKTVKRIRRGGAKRRGSQ